MLHSATGPALCLSVRDRKFLNVFKSVLLILAATFLVSADHDMGLLITAVCRKRIKVLLAILFLCCH